MRRWAAGAVAPLMILAAGCTSPSVDSPRASPRPGAVEPRLQSGGTVTFGVLGEPESLDPNSPDANALTFALAEPVYPQLFETGAEGRPAPSLARSLRPAEGGVQVRLRSARWSDDSTIAASDVVASVRAARRPSGLRGLRARALGRRVVELRGTSGAWRRRLATSAFIFPAGRATSGVGGGPFVARRFRPGLEVVLRRNPVWFGGRARLRTVRVAFTESTETIRRLLERGRLDAAALPSSINLGDRLKQMGLELSSALGSELVYLDFGGGGLSRPQRVAVARGIDRARLESFFVRDAGALSNTLHPTGTDRSGPWQRAYGPSAPPAGKVQLFGPAGDELLVLLGRALFEQLEDAGVPSEPLEVASSELGRDFVRAEKPDVVLQRTSSELIRASDARAFAGFEALPLAQVESLVTWAPGLRGPRASGSPLGPLWNLETWGFVAEQ